MLRIPQIVRPRALGPLALAALASTLATFPGLPAQDRPARPTLDEVRTLFRRPARTPITAEQKERLGAWLETHGVEPTGDFGWLCAIDAYLDRDYDRAGDLLDRYFEQHGSIPVEEHATMAGRIYLNSTARDLRRAEPDVERMARRLTYCTRIYPDLEVVGSVIDVRLREADDATATKLRLAAARGALDSDASDDTKLRFVRRIVGADQGTKVRATKAIPIVRAGGGAAGDASAARNAAESTRAALTGKKAPDLAIEHVVQGGEGVQLQEYLGKVVLLDFTATWCGPCRKVIPHLKTLRERHAGALEVLAVSRFYGYGSDYRDGNKGLMVRDLSKEDEIAVNEAFAEAFELPYPVVLVERATMSEAYGVTGIPCLFVVGRDGKVVGHVTGAGEASEKAVDALVARALGE